MGRLRVRDTENTRWIDICQSEFYVRNASDTGWYRLLPARGMYARHGGNNYWIQIGCTTDDPSGCPDEYGGTPDGNGENGSGPGAGGGTGGGAGGGTGGGSGGNGGGDTNNGGDGVTFDPSKPYAPGYGYDIDLGDNDYGDTDIDIIDTGDGNLVILDPSSGDVETYDPGKDGSGGEGGGGGGNGSDGRKGTWQNPYLCPVTISGRGYQVTEFYVDLGSVSGTVKMHYNIRGAKASINVYHGGRRVITTGKDKIQGRGVKKFEFNAANAGGDGRIFVRVSAQKGAVWDVMFECPSNTDTDDYGTPSNPATCRGSFSPTNHGGGAGVHENTHTMGKGGEVVIEYQMWYQPDRMDIVYRGQIIASTNTHVSGEGRLVFNFAPVGNDTDITVRISSMDGTTSWAYLMTCPDEKGSTLYPKACGPDSATTSGGAGVTDTYFSMEGQPAGPMAVRYQMWNIPDKCEVYQNGTLVAATPNAVAGENYLRFNYDPARGTQLRVRIIGPDNKTSWSFLIECPNGTPKINAGDVSVREGQAGQTSQMCFPITLSTASGSPVTVDYATAPGTAAGVIAEARILATDEYNIPFIAVSDDPSAGRLVMDGGFPKFYNTFWVEPLAAPTTDTVFNTWNRTSNGDFFVDNAATPSGSEAKAWSYSTSDSSIRSTVNSSTYIGFLSPTEWDTYTYECTIGSSDGDDDQIGVIVAFEREGSTNHAIVAMRQQGGSVYSGSGNWNLFYLVNGTPTTHIQGKAVGSNSGGWSGRYSRVRVEREGNRIRVYCSPFNSTAIAANSVLEVDLNSNANFTRFKGTTKWGFCAQSQNNAYFKDILFEGIGMAPQFTYLKNAVKWIADPNKPAPKKVLVICDKPTGGIYSLDNAAQGFGIGVPKAIQALGYQTVVTDIYSVPLWNAAAALPLSDLKQYAAIVMIGSQSDSTNHFTAASIANITQFVKEGGGLMLITDHDVFQGSVNPLAKNFNAEFYGSVDRSQVSVDAMIAKHGDHPVWDGLDGKAIPAGASEGGIRVNVVKGDFKPTAGTVTFAPGETSKTVCVDITGDDDIEPDETVKLVLSNPKGGELGTATGTGTIINDDSPLCRQNPTAPVYERSGGPNGSYLLFVQKDFNCAAGNTMYLMMRDFNFANSGPHVFSFLVDDDYEFYIDCKKVATGTIGAVRTHTINVEAGLRNLILRYSNVPNCTPSYVGMSISYNGSVIMVTRAADWKGQANVIGEI